MSARWIAPVAVLSLLLLAGCAGEDTTAPEATPVPEGVSGAETALWLSDVHFNPFYPKPPTGDSEALVAALLDTTQTPHIWRDHSEWDAVFDQFPQQTGGYSTRGQDANAKTFRDVLAQASATLPAPSMVVVTGDLLAHDFGSHYDTLAPVEMRTFEGYDAFVAETIAYVAASIRQAVGPAAPVVATLGNNDSFCGDYDIRLDADGSDFLRTTADTALEYFLPGLSPAEQDSFRTSFAHGGRYAVDIPNGQGSRLLVINSIALIDGYPETWDLVAPYGTVCARKPSVDPSEQLDWLAEQAGQPGTAWVAMHIPPGTACYDGSSSWDATATYTADFAALFGPSAPLAGAFAAHSHMASFKLVGSPPLGFVLQGPSISPNHHNNPTFGVLTYDPVALTISDYEVHYLDIGDGTWGSFAFAGIEGPITVAALDSVHTGLTDPATRARFQDSYRSFGPATGPDSVGLGQLAANDFGCLVGVQ